MNTKIWIFLLLTSLSYKWHFQFEEELKKDFKKGVTLV